MAAVTSLERLHDAVLTLPQPAFAVLDGSAWPDLPVALGRHVLVRRSLFVDAGPSITAAGPWLVPLDRPGASKAVLAVLEDKPAAVFWSCPAGARALNHHLRTLNQARLEQAGAASVTVTFRHWDPRVLSMTMPLLDGSQYARVMGPSQEAVLLDPEDLGGFGLRRLVRFPELPEPPHGLLALRAEQVAALDGAVQERSRRKVATYLRAVAPELTGRLDEEQLRRRVLQCEESGRTLGLANERAQMKWALLMFSTNGRVEGMPEVTGFIRSGAGGSPDGRMDQAMRQVLGAAAARDAARR